MRTWLLASALAAAAAERAMPQQTAYSLSDAGATHVFDGIGGLSGGGATSRLLPSYPEPYRSQILDFLFKPGFGASLHILKTEIGGDAQSTDGSEPSHMHTPLAAPNFQRGYEWWLMKEAKARNPAIKLYGLSWAYPEWVACSSGLSNCTLNNDPFVYPAKAVNYTLTWLQGAKEVHGLDIDYIGVWNERPFSAPYIKLLRSTLDAAGFNATTIVAADNMDWNIAPAIVADPALAEAVGIIGVHYPGTESTAVARGTGKQLWASEDVSTANNNVGAACFSRVLNRNFVNGQMTATIVWNLISAYMKGTNWWRCGLMTALQPWAGAYVVDPLIWVAAHTTQFTQPGWVYAANGTGPGTGSGPLSAGGSYVTIVEKPGKAGTRWALVIEKMSAANSPCVRPSLAPYETAPETATFTLDGALGGHTTLHLWRTQLVFGPPSAETDQEEFTYVGPISVGNDGSFTVDVPVDALLTVSPTAPSQAHGPWKGSYPSPPPPAVFPAVHTDTYDEVAISQEADYWTDQNGSWEVNPAPGGRTGHVMAQTVPLRPITWGSDVRPHSFLGSADLVNVSYFHDVYLPTAQDAAMLGARGQGQDSTAGVLWSFDGTGAWNVSFSVAVQDTPLFAVAKGTLPVHGFGPGQWHTYRLDVNGTRANGWVDGIPVFTDLDVSGAPASGFVLMGTVEYGQFPAFDNLVLYSTHTQCRAVEATSPLLVAGAPLVTVPVHTEIGAYAGSSFDFQPVASTTAGSGVYALRAVPSLCMATVPTGGSSTAWPTALAPCNVSDPHQLWAPAYTQLYSSFIFNPASGRCLDMDGGKQDIGTPVIAWPCNFQDNENFYYDFHPWGELLNINTATAIGVC